MAGCSVRYDVVLRHWMLRCARGVFTAAARGSDCDAAARVCTYSTSNHQSNIGWQWRSRRPQLNYESLAKNCFIWTHMHAISVDVCNFMLVSSCKRVDDVQNVASERLLSDCSPENSFSLGKLKTKLRLNYTAILDTITSASCVNLPQYM